MSKMRIFKAVVLAAVIGLGFGGCNADGGLADAGDFIPLWLPLYFIEMELIPAGTFTMGSPDTEPWTPANLGGVPFHGQTRHEVTLTKNFYMGKHVVTQDQYRTVMGKNPSFFNNTGAKTDNSTGTPVDYDTTPAPGEIQGKRPVEMVSWYDALVFCNRLSIATELTPAYRIYGSTNPAEWGPVPTGAYTPSEEAVAAWNAVEIVEGSKGYRLPTEAQWEYACRAGTETSYNNGVDAPLYWGTLMSDQLIANALADDPDMFADIPGWHRYNSGDKTRDVSAGDWGPNAWGLYNMHGNVWEWCWDKQTRLADYNLGDLIDPMGPATGGDRIERNGGFRSRPDAWMRSGARNSLQPSNKNNDLGFRVVRPE